MSKGTWTLTFSGNLEEVLEAAKSISQPEKYSTTSPFVRTEISKLNNNVATPDVMIPQPYSWRDVAAFSPSAAIYFMDGFSEAHIRIRKSEEEFSLKFWDQNTAISASDPVLFDETQLTRAFYTPAPAPLISQSFIPENTPERYLRKTTFHGMQVISMNMKSKDTDSRLLIGLPYAEKYPQLFHRTDLFGETRKDKSASSFGMVQSLTEYTDLSGETSALLNGYPARSFFAIYHLIETPLGALFNKRATQMELQPTADGKLALKLPPIPFSYSLINGPIPLFLADDPEGEPVADLLAAKHHDGNSAVSPTADAWPWHQPNLEKIRSSLAKS
jgi:hypothetical protein